MGTQTPNIDLELIREVIRRRRDLVVISSPTALVRTFWEDLVIYRNNKIDWAGIVEDLKVINVNFSELQLRTAFRNERVRRRRAKSDLSDAAGERLPGAAALLERYADVTPEQARVRPSRKETTTRIPPAPDKKSAEQPLTIEGNLEIVNTPPVATNTDEVVSAAISSAAPLLAEVVVDQRINAEDEIAEDIEIKDGRVFWKNGSALDKPLPLRVILMLKRNGRYIAPDIGRTTKYMVKVEN